MKRPGEGPGVEMLLVLALAALVVAALTWGDTARPCIHWTRVTVGGSMVLYEVCDERAP